MGDVEVNPDALASLAEKIEGLNLTAEEHAVLGSILERAEAYEPEVEGFGMSSARYGGATSGSDLGRGAFTLGISAGLVRMPGGRRFDPTDPDKQGWPPIGD